MYWPMSRRARIATGVCGHRNLHRRRARAVGPPPFRTASSASVGVDAKPLYEASFGSRARGLAKSGAYLSPSEALRGVPEATDP